MSVPAFTTPGGLTPTGRDMTLLFFFMQNRENSMNMCADKPRDTQALEANVITIIEGLRD